MPILLDFGGTLDGDGLRWSVRFHRAYREAGGRLDFPAFETLFLDTNRRLATLPGIRHAGFLATIEALARLLAPRLEAGDEPIRIEQLAEPVHSSAVAAVDANRPVLERLARSSLLGMVSNFYGNLDRCLDELGLEHLFDVVLDSAAVGIAKPDPRIFGLALSRVGGEPDGSWMVGDSPTADILPAAALGLKTAWVAPEEDRRTWGPGIPTVRGTTLVELEPALAAPCRV